MSTFPLNNVDSSHGSPGLAFYVCGGLFTFFVIFVQNHFSFVSFDTFFAFARLLHSGVQAKPPLTSYLRFPP